MAGIQPMSLLEKELRCRIWEVCARAALPGPIGAALLLVPLLTARELVAFRLLGTGCDNNSIARRMNISERTTKRHVTAILIKLGLESRLQAGLAAMAIALVATRPAPFAERYELFEPEHLGDMRTDVVLPLR